MALDPNDPILEPIEGITIEKFAEISVGLAKSGKTNWDEVAPFVELKGVKEGTWQTVQTGWMGNMGSNQELQVYYGTLFAKLMSS
ncbi:hypothetical protein ACFL20_12655 [Spirochaetota bacterium]